MFKKDKRPSFSFPKKKFMWGCLEKKYLFKLFRLTERGKQYKYIINIPSVEDRLQTMRAIFEPFIFKTAHKKLARAGPKGDPIATPSICL